MTDKVVYPDNKWEKIKPEKVNMDSKSLSKIDNWLERNYSDATYRIAVVRSGYMVANWNKGIENTKLKGLASAAKSVYSSILGIAIDEGKIKSPDSKLIDYYPEGIDIPEGYGPKEGRYVFEKDKDITLRQLISNTSGYMKPNEKPGKVFHYQTFGMNVTAHAIAKAYGLYDVNNPEESPGIRRLIDEKIKKPIGAKWDYFTMNFNHPHKAKVNVFGYYEGISSDIYDMCRLGWLWNNEGKWKDKQLIPKNWLSNAVKVAPAIKENCPENQWKYGYGFWSNEYKQMWESLPSDSYAAWGAGKNLIWVCPSLDLVVAQSPGMIEKGDDKGILKMIVKACE